MGTILLIIPAQAALSRNIVKLRAAAAARTDERVRLTGELLEGSLPVKMLCWELPFQRALLKIRAFEVAQMRKLLLIEACGMAMMFFCTPLASFVTSAVAIAAGAPPCPLSFVSWTFAVATCAVAVALGALPGPLFSSPCDLGRRRPTWCGTLRIFSPLQVCQCHMRPSLGARHVALR